MRTVKEKITKDLYLLRADDDRTKYFESIWNIPEGITCNVYLLSTGDKVFLFESWKRAYADRFIELLREIVDPRDIDFIFIHHMEQDHIGEAIPEIIDSQAMIIGASTYENDTFPSMRYMLDLVVDEIKVGKPVLTIASNGWGGTTASMIAKRLGEAGFMAVDSVDFRGRPTQVDIDRIRKGVGLLL